MEKNRETTETFRDVFKRYTVLLVVCVLLFGLVTGGSLLMQRQRANNENLHYLGTPVEMDLQLVDFLAGDSESSLGTVLTETAPVGADYFADTMFIGDSLTDGMRIYGEFLATGVRAVSTKGINTHNALTNTFYDIGDGNKMTMIDAIEYYKPRKVYIMLGTNGLNWETAEWNLEGYEILVDEIIRRVPGCYIIIQSIPPTTAATASKIANYSIENMARYNDGLRDIALRKGVYFLDVHSALVNAAGYMDESISANDGIHMVPSGYSIWFNYIITHAVQGEAAFGINGDGRISYVQRSQSDENEQAIPPDPDADGSDPAVDDGSGAAPPDEII